MIRFLRPVAGVLLLQLTAATCLSQAFAQGFNRHEPCGLGFALDPECQGEAQQPTGGQSGDDGGDPICSGEKLDAIRDGYPWAVEAFIAAMEDERDSDAETLLQRIEAHERDWKKARIKCPSDRGPIRALLDADVAERLYELRPKRYAPPADLIGGAG